MKLKDNVKEDSLAIKKKLPEIASVEVLQKYTDGAILGGLKLMEKLSCNANDPQTAINAYKNVLATARFLHQRSGATNPVEEELIDDFEEVEEFDNIEDF